MTSPMYVAPAFTEEIRKIAFPQNLPSIVVSHVLNPQPGETILDMCAAPGKHGINVRILILMVTLLIPAGGKTTHMAILMEEKVGTLRRLTMTVNLSAAHYIALVRAV